MNGCDDAKSNAEKLFQWYLAMTVRTRPRRRRAQITGKGIATRHSRTCLVASDRACNCQPSFQAWIYDDGKKIRRTFPTKAAAAKWRSDQLDRLYGRVTGAHDGRLDAGYSLVRRALGELQTSRKHLPVAARSDLNDAMAALYKAEDALLACLRLAPLG